MKANNQRKKCLVGVAFNLQGQVSEETVNKLRRRAWRFTESTQTIFFDDNSAGGQSCFVFEIYDLASASFIERLCYYIRKIIATAFRYVGIRNCFVSVIIEDNLGRFPVNGTF